MMMKKRFLTNIIEERVPEGFKKIEKGGDISKKTTNLKV